jgi:hypothetical protein
MAHSLPHPTICAASFHDRDGFCPRIGDKTHLDHGTVPQDRLE